MKKLVVSIFVVCLYCFPFVYFSMYQDFANRSMNGYLLLIVASIALSFIGTAFGSPISLIIGNIASYILSFYFIKEMGIGEENWNFYFKPFTPNMLLLFVSLLNLVPQLFMWMLGNKYKNKKPPTSSSHH